MRLRHAAFALLATALLGDVDGTFASFSATTSNEGSVSADVVLQPTGLAAEAVGDDVVLTWDPAGMASGASGFGHRVEGRSLGVGDTEPAGCDPDTGTWSWSGRFGEDGTGTRVGGGGSATAGSWWCFRVRGEYPAAPATARWQRDAAEAVVVKVGHVVESYELVDGGTPGELAEGDQVIMRFNLPVDTTTGPQDTEPSTGDPTSGNDVCVHGTSNVMIIGRDTSLLGNLCAGSNARLAGRLNVDVGPDGERVNHHASYEWFDDDGAPCENACTELHVQIGRRHRGGGAVTMTVAASAASTSVIPGATSGALLAMDGTPLCTSTTNENRLCRPVPTGSL
ncbi:MAG TPA: hypothetical protein VEA78_04295 [Acidimicrobiales bacterium]|nr:hypothetical protein [Acidimicrobiales bacterium]